MKKNITALALVGILAAAAFLGDAREGWSACTKWNLSSDFIAFTNTTAPTLSDACGNTVWYLYESNTSAFSPQAVYTPLAYYSDDGVWSKGWGGSYIGAYNGHYPGIAVNYSGADYIVTATDPDIVIPKDAISAHPSPNNMVVTEWRSPAAGTVQVDVTFKDLDPAVHYLDDGFYYLIHKEGDTAPLYEGPISKGGSVTQQLTVDVATGTSLYFGIGPGPANLYWYDSTQLDLTITRYVGLQATASGQGSVAVSPEGGTYLSGTVVTLTAQATAGWIFDHWEGSLAGTANPAELLMDDDKVVTAVFVQLPSPPAAPTRVAVKALSGGNALVTWRDNSTNETGFGIQRETYVKGLWTATTSLGPVGANVTSFTDHPGAGKFRYAVRAFNTGGFSAWSPWVMVTVK